MFRNLASQWFSTGVPGVLTSPGLADAGSTSDKAARGARGLNSLPLAFCVTQAGLFPSLGLSFFICKMTTVSFP